MTTKRDWLRIKNNPELLEEHNRKKRARQKRQWAKAKEDPEAIAALRKRNHEAGLRWLAKLETADPEKYAEIIVKRREKDRRLKAELRKHPEFYPKFNAYCRNRRKISPQFRLSQALRNTINCALRGRYRMGTLIEMLGCTPSELMRHLEAGWTDGMTWETYGHGKGKWSVDHIRPCASFDLSDPGQQKICFHYSNLKPMWFVDNCSKSSIVNGRKHRHDDHPSMWKSPCIPDKPA